jgi:hypothetical protein
LHEGLEAENLQVQKTERGSEEEEMTYEEYKKLYEEWKNTDSKSRSEEIEETIAEVSCGLLHRLVNLYAKRGAEICGGFRLSHRHRMYESGRGCP